MHYFKKRVMHASLLSGQKLTKQHITLIAILLLQLLIRYYASLVAGILLFSPLLVTIVLQ